MQKVTVTYRKIDYSIDIDLPKSVLDLKMIVSDLTRIKPENFKLRLDKIILIENKEMSDYLKNGNKFTVVHVKINICLNLDGIIHMCDVLEKMNIDVLAKNIVRLTGCNNEISLYYGNQKLDGKNTLLSSGVKHNATLTVVNESNAIKKVTIKYREKSYSIYIDETKVVQELEEEASKLTGIKVGNFALKSDQIYMMDTKEIKHYLVDRNILTMTNVIISVNIILFGKEHTLFVKEEEKVDDLLKTIMTKFDLPNVAYLYYNNRVLQATDSILSCQIENNSVVIAVINNDVISPRQIITVTYRYTPYSLDVDTTITVAALKKLVSNLADIKPEYFSLQFHWILLIDENPISHYLKYGTNLTMTDVTIKVTVKLNAKNYSLFVKEAITVDAFKVQVIEKSGHKSGISLFCNNRQLEGNESLLACEVEHNGVVTAVTTLSGGFQIHSFTSQQSLENVLCKLEFTEKTK